MSKALTDLDPGAAAASRRLAAYNAGRLLNQLNWQLQLCRFWPDEENETRAVFDQLAGIPYAFSTDSATAIKDRILLARERWSDAFDCEEFAVDYFRERDEAYQRYSDVSIDDARAILISCWCDPLWKDVHEILLANLNDEEKTLVELGMTVDEGLRRDDVHKFMWQGQADQSRLLENHKPRPGDQLPDSSWRPRVAALASKLGLTLGSVNEPTEQRESIFDEVDSINESIQVHLNTSTSDSLEVSLAPRGDDFVAVDYVTLKQMAAIVKKRKRTIERLKEDGKLPTPEVKGRPGQAAEWSWAKIRPILELQYDRKLPEIFPADQFSARSLERASPELTDRWSENMAEAT